MGNVLIISYFFPPMGGAGVQRTLKFVKYLPEFGWQPHVLTVRNTVGLQDPSLAKEIPAELPVTRTPFLQLPPRWPWRLRNFISRWFLIVDEQIGWMPFAASAGRKIISSDNIQAIYSTSAPYTAHLIARRLHHQTKLPWVADFRDPWAGNFYQRFATPLHSSLIQRLERQVVQEADHITVVSQPIGESFRERIPGIPPAKITWLPNGFDRQDFVNVRPAKRGTDRFYLVYTGSFYNQGRTADPILHAVHSLVTIGQIPRQRFCVQLIGDIGKSTQRWIKELGLEDVVETPGYMPHNQSIGHLMAADALLLVIGDFPGSSGVYTGKIFEYLAAGKPILCLATEGVSSNLIRTAHAGIVTPPNDASQIIESLAGMYQQWERGELKIDPDLDIIASFERQKLTNQLANLLTEICK